MKLSLAPYAVDDFETFRRIGRAVALAAAVNDSERLARAKTSLFQFRDRCEARGSQYPFWLFDELVWEQRSVLMLTDDEVSAVIGSLERTLSSCKDSSSPQTFDPHMALDAANRLARWRNLTKDIDEARRASKEAGEAIETAAAMASGLTAIALLEGQVERYRSAGDEASAARVEHTIMRRAEEAKGELNRITVPIGISDEEINNWAELMAGPSLAEGIGRVVGGNLIGKERSEKAVIELSRISVLQATIPIAIMRDDGFTSAKIGSVSDDLSGRTVHHASNELGYSAPFLAVALDRLRKNHNAGVEDFVAWLSDSRLFSGSRLALVQEGITAWFAEDWIKTVHVLVPQIEAVLRDLLSLLGGAVMKTSKDFEGFRAIGLGDVLRHERFVAAIPMDVRFHLNILFTDPRGINLRNEVAHGIANRELFGRGIANWVIHALLMVGFLRPTANP
jgi:hypothetical protein